MYKHIPVILILLSCIYQYADALFFGPSAVGLGLGILAFKKGFLIGTYLSNRRTRRSYNPHSNYNYRQNHHYNSGYNSGYSRPRKYYYYSSRQYNYGGYRGKRDTTHQEELAELHRIKREIEEAGFDMNGWYRDMTEQDQDSCGKKLICELSARQASGSLTSEESILADKFGSGKAVDVSEITVEFDLASQIGKFMGQKRCAEMYNRCDVSSGDMVTMIKQEYENLKVLQRDLEENEFSIDNEIDQENKQLKKEMEKMEDSADKKKAWEWY